MSLFGFKDNAMGLSPQLKMWPIVVNCTAVILQLEKATLLPWPDSVLSA